MDNMDPLDPRDLRASWLVPSLSLPLIVIEIKRNEGGKVLLYLFPSALTPSTFYF